MEQNKILETKAPEAIIIPAGGSVRGDDGSYRSTSYEDGDAFGTLGGYSRVEAASLLAKKYPSTVVVPSGKGSAAPGIPSHAQVMEGELIELGVERRRILLEENSTTTLDGVMFANKLAVEKGWHHLIIVSNKYHLPRLQAMWESLGSEVEAIFVAAEDIIIAARPEFKTEFDIIKGTPSYLKRLESEARGLEAFRSGAYRSASSGDKKERLV